MRWESLLLHLACFLRNLIMKKNILRNQFTSAKVMMKHHESCVLLTHSVYPQTSTKHFAIPVTQMMLKITSLQNSRHMHVTIHCVLAIYHYTSSSEYTL